MNRLKPLLASLATIAIALMILLTWGLLRGKPAQRTSSNDILPAANFAPTGLLYEETTLESRPLYDPPYVWPDDGMRMSSGEFWVMWQTREFSKCRLLGTKDQKLWYDLGSTGGTSHYLKVELGFFESRVTFAIDFTQDGKNYRSRPRTVSFGKGASFAQRQYRFAVGDAAKDRFKIMIDGRDPGQMRNFLHGWFPAEVAAYYSPQPGQERGGELLFGVQEGSRVPAEGCMGFVQLFDELTVTYDRTLVVLARK